MAAVIGDPRKAGEAGPAGDQRKAGEEGVAGDPRPAGEQGAKAGGSKRKATRDTTDAASTAKKSTESADN